MKFSEEDIKIALEYLRQKVVEEESYEAAYLVAADENADSNILNFIYLNFVKGFGNSQKTNQIRRLIAINKNTPVQVLKELSRASYFSFINVCCNKNAPADYLAKVAVKRKYKDIEIRRTKNKKLIKEFESLTAVKEVLE